MKVRIGYGLGTRTPTLDGGRFGALLDALEDLRFDSLWLSERLGGECPDPLVGLSFAAARTRKLKLGTSVQVLPGRNPADVAKAWATLDRLSGGRALPAFGLGVADPAEQQLFGVERKQRAALFDEAIGLVRRFWTGEPVDHDGARWHYRGARIAPTPVQSPPDIWLGGRAPAELRRVGRLGDGWLPSFCTAEDVATGRPTIEAEAAAHGRTMDPEHWGVLLPYLPAPGPRPDVLVAAVAARRPAPDAAGSTGAPRSPEEVAAEIVPAGMDEVVDAVGRFLDAGASKFVLVPVVEPEDWEVHLREVAAAVRPLEN